MDVSILKDFDIDPTSKYEFDLNKSIGGGAFGDVYKGYCKETNKLVALKVLRHDNSSSKSLDYSFCREIAVSK